MMINVIYRKILAFIRKHLDTEFLREDARKVGINFVIAGIIGVFTTHLSHLDIGFILTSLWVILFGILALLVGLWRRKA